MKAHTGQDDLLVLILFIDETGDRRDKGKGALPC